MHINTGGHHHLREQIPAASGGSAQTQRERPNSVGAPTYRGDFMAVSGGSAKTRLQRLNSEGASKLEPIYMIYIESGFHGRLWWERQNSAGAPKLGGSAQTLQQGRCIYEGPSLRSYAVCKD